MKHLHEIFNRPTFDIITERILKDRKVDMQDKVTYVDFDHLYEGVTYAIKPVHVPIDYIFKYGVSSCKQCVGKGYFVTKLFKRNIPKPADYVILSEQPIKNMTDEQKKMFIEMEKKKPLWRVMLPCSCALKKAQIKEPDLVMTADGHIIVRMTYTVAEKSFAEVLDNISEPV